MAEDVHCVYGRRQSNPRYSTKVGGATEEPLLPATTVSIRQGIEQEVVEVVVLLAERRVSRSEGIRSDS